MKKYAVSQFILFSITLSTLIVFLSGCSTKIDPSSVQATGGSPASASVPEVSVTYRADAPTYVLSVEPFEFTPPAYQSDPRFCCGNNTGGVWVGGVNPQSGNVPLGTRLENGGNDLRAKLVSTLTGVGNFSVLDPRGLRLQKDGTYAARLNANEKGPYLVRVTVTEFSERIEEQSNEQSLNTTFLGVVLGIAGAVADVPGLFWPGVGLTAANIDINSSDFLKTGMVAMDVQVVDGKSLRVVSAFRTSGTFRSRERKSGVGLFGYSQSSSEFAQSVLGQATQLAINDAANRLSKELIR
jgi:curli biogenesis system outer membrane secretion channel CsgG